MNHLAIAFDEALDAAEEVKGYREKVIFRGNEIDALFYDFTTDIDPWAGGSIDAIPLKISVRLDDCLSDPTELEHIEVRGQVYEILTFDRLEGRMDLMCGHSETDMQ